MNFRAAAMTIAAILVAGIAYVSTMLAHQGRVGFNNCYTGLTMAPVIRAFGIPHCIISDNFGRTTFWQYGHVTIIVEGGKVIGAYLYQ